jgi:Xaa-Pro dipeptidase
MQANYVERITFLRKLMQKQSIDLVAINAGKDLKFITGLEFHLSERPVILVVSRNDPSILFFPAFEMGKAKTSPLDLNLSPYDEDADKWGKILGTALEGFSHKNPKIAVSPESFRFLELDLLQTALGYKSVQSGQEIFKQLYIQKDISAIESIKEAVGVAERAFKKLTIRPGQTEKQVANELFINLLREGSEQNLPFEPIVATGTNSANPHSFPGERIIQKGDTVIIDWGARCNGYVSDITRTFQIEIENPEIAKISEIVLGANIAARKKIKPGIQASEVDQAARRYIEDRGYGKFFTHRTGHGIGLEAHENPYISQTSKEVLKAGMVFTIEPGIYIPDKGGVRIEDNVLVTENGFKTLTNLPREISVI